MICLYFCSPLISLLSCGNSNYIYLRTSIFSSLILFFSSIEVLYRCFYIFEEVLLNMFPLPSWICEIELQVHTANSIVWAFHSLLLLINFCLDYGSYFLLLCMSLTFLMPKIIHDTICMLNVSVFLPRCCDHLPRARHLGVWS